MDPENIAPFVTFLASDAAADITGQAFIVWGGTVAHVRLPHVSDHPVENRSVYHRRVGQAQGRALRECGSRGL